MPSGMKVLCGLGAGAGLVVTLALLAGGCSRPVPTSPASQGRNTREDFLTAAREGLLKSGDLAICRYAVQQLNQHFQQQPAGQRPELSEAERQLLTKRYGLEKGELEEVASSVLTGLDVRYLESCLLFRDAARALVPHGASPAEQAAAAFAWTVRQVRLREGPGAPVPAQLVLRRGWGTAVERGLVFFSLLQQLGLDSCFLALPGPSQEQPRYWVCGVLVPGGTKPEIQLFDCRLGLPLPGPKGQGTATLSQVRTQPEVLQQLTVGKEEYDVSPEQARTAEVHVAAPLSALAPRLRQVEELLGPTVRVKLVVKPAGLLKRFEEAAAVAGSASDRTRPPVRVARIALSPLRDFLTPEEGGIAKTRQPVVEIPFEFWPPVLDVGEHPQRQMRYFFVRPFEDFALQTRMPREEYLRGRFIYLGKPSNPDQARMPSDLSVETETDPAGSASQGERRDTFRGSVAEVEARRSTTGQAQTEALDRARMPRDLLLHGLLDDATRLLTRMEEQLRSQRDRLRNNPELVKQVLAWREKMIEAQARFLRGEPAPDLARRQRDQVLEEGAKSWMPVLEGTAAVPLLEEVIYQLALCMHERAERLQTQLDRGQKAGKTSASLADDVRYAWREAANWWDTFLKEYAGRPKAESARRWRARVHAMLGERDAAAKLLRSSTDNLPPLQRLARAYEARRLTTP